MTAPQHVPGPWEPNVEGNGDVFAGDLQIADCDFPQGELTPEVIEANARLMADAPAMSLALALIATGAARIERAGRLVEFCFNGLRYSLSGCWSDVIDAIGWSRARAAVGAKP